MIDHTAKQERYAEGRELDLSKAMEDVGITEDRETVIGELWKCGWTFDEKTGLLVDET